MIAPRPNTKEQTLIIDGWVYQFHSFEGSVSNGEWTIDDIEAFTGKTDHHNCCGKEYSTVKYKISLTRKPDYIMFYLSPPAIVLVLLSIMSFFIPTESGERIGFVTTILLALMVFLLMIPEYLPRTSDQLPILGILLIFAMVIISVVLVCTIFILKCHHHEGIPPVLTKKIFFPRLSRSTKKRGHIRKLNSKVNEIEVMELEDCGSVSNGEWTIDDIVVFNQTIGRNGCCGEFSTITYNVSLTRKPGLFYLSPPVIILVLLSIMSFFIPTESGERIGFITTILLALMVFLLMIPEYLPRTSDQLPILGILLILSLVIISGVLIATIMILLCHYREGTPPVVIQNLFFPLRSRFKKRNDIKPSGEMNEAVEMRDVEMAYNCDQNEISPENEDKITWQHISRKLNWISFCLICVLTLFSSIAFLQDT
ncbi:hypothetical protein QZH41_011415 [Actinostola sp. cb2023]|nr:hypothetical protein QZH41_011415 [Actinostola sp. cb2023]